MDKFGKIVRLVVAMLLAVAVLFFALSLAISTVSRARSGQVISEKDAEQLAHDLDKLRRVWSKGGALGDVQQQVRKADDGIGAALLALRKTPGQEKSLGDLEAISAHLLIIRKVMEIEETDGGQIVKEMEDVVKRLKEEAEAPHRTVAGLFEGALAWVVGAWVPLLVFALIGYLLFVRSAPARLKNLLGGFKTLEFGPAKIELEESKEAKANAEATFAEYRARATSNFDLGVQRYDVHEKVTKVVAELRGRLAVIRNLPPEQVLRRYRCTIHVPDIVLAATMCQLIDYLPTGSGRGRVFSVRFGLIGKVWRRWKGELQAQLPTGPGAGETLVREWGMTPLEAEIAARGRPSFLGVPLDLADSRVGIFYMDAEDETAFGTAADQDWVVVAVQELCTRHHLTEALSKIKDDLSGVAPLIEIHKS